MNRRVSMAPLVACLLLAACVPLPPAAVAPTGALPAHGTPVATAMAAPVTETAPIVAGPIPEEALMKATYSGIYDAPIALTGGLFRGEPVQGSAARPTVEFMEGAGLYGDLDRDGVEDAVVFLIERGGGSGSFTYVAAQLSRDGHPFDAGAAWIGDRIQVRSAAVEDGRVLLDIVTQGPGDVACCGRHKARKTYALQEGRLVEIAGEDANLQLVSAGDLENTSWRLLELDFGQPALSDAVVTASFQQGRMAGSTGCNSYTTNFSLDGLNPFILSTGPVAATKKGCPEPAAAQETAYLAALEDASQWAYMFGRLALYYTDEAGEPARLLFEPETTRAQ